MRFNTTRMSGIINTTRSGRLKILGEERTEGRSTPAFGLIVLFSIFVSVLYVATSGSLLTAMSAIGLLAILLLTFYRLDWGFMLFVGLVLIFDQFPPRGYERSIIGVQYFENLKSLSLFESVGPAVMNPLELHMFLIFLVWIILIASGRKLTMNRVYGWLPMVLFFGWLVVSTAMGILKGGDFLVSLWEIRALFYLGIVSLFVPQIIQTREQIVQLVGVIITALSFKVLQGLVRVINLGFDFGIRTELTSHEDPLFFVTLFLLAAGLYLYRVRTRQVKVLLYLMIPAILVFILAQRRATYGALAVGMVAFFILIGGRQKKVFLKFAFPAFIAAMVYLGAFWNSESPMALPAKLVRSSISSEKEDAGERYYSNLYRDYENYNLAETFKKAPVVGIGFGNKYDQPVALSRIRFSLRDYIPHNEIFWIIVKTGTVGYVLFWTFINVVLVITLRNILLVRDDYLRVVCIVTVTALLGQIVVSFFDLQLTFYRNMIFLGTLTGIQSSITGLRDRAETSPDTSPGSGHN